MLAKIESTGCCVRKGMVQVRFCFYLEPADARYDEHYVQVPESIPVVEDVSLTPPSDSMEILIPAENFEELPKVWQNNPFHNHFIYVEPDATDEEIMGIGEAFLQESYGKWVKNEIPNPKNKPVKFLEFVSNKRLKACEAKVKHLKTTPMERKSKWLQ